MSASGDFAERAERAEILQYREGSLQACFDYLDPCPPQLIESSIDVPLPDGTNGRAIITRPKGTVAEPMKCPLIILFHGGGWFAGAPEQMLVPARGYANRLGAIVACASYKLAPENTFPAPMKSAWEVTSWLACHENLNNGLLKDEHIEVDTSLGIVVGGASAGAHIAAVVAGVAAETAANREHSTLAGGLSKLTQPISGVFLSVPVLVHETILPPEYAPIWTSRVDNADAPILPTKKLEVDEARLDPDYRSPWFSPLNIDLDAVRGYHAPRVYVQAGELDCLRDDAVVYERIMRDKGISDTKIDIVDGADHDGWSTFSNPLWGHGDTLRKASLDGTAWLLGKDWDKSQHLPY